MTSFDVGVSLASIVQGYRTYGRGDIFIINGLVKKGEWDDSYLLALMDNLDLDVIFDTAVRVNNIPAMEAVYPKKRFSLDRCITYMVKKDDLDGILSYPNYQGNEDTRIFGIACMYNNHRIVNHYLADGNAILVCRGLALAERYNHRDLVRLFIQKRSPGTQSAIEQILGQSIIKDNIAMVSEILSHIDSPTRKYLNHIVLHSVNYNSSKVFEYFLKQGKVNLRCQICLFNPHHFNIIEIAIQNHNLNLDFLIDKFIEEGKSNVDFLEDILGLTIKYNYRPDYFKLIHKAEKAGDKQVIDILKEYSAY